LSRSRAKGDAFLELLHPLQKPLESFCRRMLRDRSFVEDVLQSAIAAAWAEFQRQSTIANFKAWIFRFVTLEIFNRNRKHHPTLLGDGANDLPVESSWELVGLEDSFESLPEAPEGVLEFCDETIVAALRNLSPQERAVLLLRAIGEFSYQEIHELLSIPFNSVMGYLSRARQRLRVALADYAAQQGWLCRGSWAKGFES
jgi:RNA polymerase sigma-70 factor (ECF subfamily)